MNFIAPFRAHFVQKRARLKLEVVVVVVVVVVNH